MKSSYETRGHFRMALFMMGIALVVMLIGHAAFAAEGDGEAKTGQQGLDAYRVLSERNMFSRERGRVVAPPPRETETSTPAEAASPPEPPPPPPPEASFLVLRGVSLVGDRATGLVEDQRDGMIHLVQSGNRIIELEVLEVELDAITIALPAELAAEAAVARESNGDAQPGTSSPPTALVISIGQNLLGKVPAVTIPPSLFDSGATGSGTSTSPTGGSAQPAGDAAANDLLERLRRRRQEELSR